MDDKYLDLAQRVASLESISVQHSKDREDIMRALESIRTSQTTESAKISSLVNKISKWEGRFGGVVFMLGCLWAFFSGAAKALIDWITLTGGVGK